MNDKFIAYCQVALSIFFLGGYFLVLTLFMMGYSKVPVDFKEAFAGLLGLMSSGGLAIIYFWFNRQRTGGIPDPATTTTTQKTETVTTPTEPKP